MSASFSERQTRALLVGAVMLIALIPRVLGIDFGLPLLLQVDEKEPLERATELLASGELSHMNAWRYPPLLAELLAIEQWLHPCETSSLALRGRLIGALASALAAGLLSDAGRKLGWPLWAAALAGLLFAVCPLEVRLARYATPDALMSALVAVTLWTCVGVAIDGRRRDYLLCGLCGGLAAATKYNAALVFVAVFVIHLLMRPRDRQAWLSLIGAGVLSIAVFASVLAWPWAGAQPFIDGLRYEWYHYDVGHAGFDCANAAWEALRYVAGFALGPIVCVGALAGGLAAFVRTRAGQPASRAGQAVSVGAAAFVLVYLALLARQHVFFARLVAPLIPALVLLVAGAAAALVELAAQRVGARHRPLLLTLVVGSLLLLPAVSTIEQVRAVRAPDARLLAYRWLDANMRGPDIKLAVLPKSTMGVVPEGVETITVARRLSISRLRQIGATHVLYGSGSVERYRLRAQDNAEVLSEWDDFHARLQAGATLVQRWEHAQPPDAAQFGDASRTIHHSSVELWKL